MVENVTKQADPADVEKNKTMAILSYFIFFLPLLTDAKDSPFAKFHANQSLVLFLTSIVGSVISSIVMMIPMGFVVSIVVYLGVLVFFVLGIMNAVNGQMKELPVIGQFHILDK
jgi:uncharacterized membrane protein